MAAFEQVAREQRRGRSPVASPLLAVAVVLVLAAVVGTTIVLERPAPPDVVQPHGDAGRSGAFQGPAVREPALRWQRNVPPSSDTGWLPPPAFDDERVYVATGGGLHAVDARSGEVRWRTTVVGYPSGEPVLAGRSVVLSGHDRIVGVDPLDGDVRWDLRLGGSGIGGLAPGDRDRVVAHRWGPTGGASAFVVDAVSGERTADVDLGGSHDGFSHMWLDGGGLVVGWASPSWSTLRRHDIRTGEVEWEADVLGEVAVGAGTVVAVVAGDVRVEPISGRLTSRRLSALDVRTGVPRWSLPAAPSVGRMVADDTRVYVSEEGGVTARDLSTGREAWAAPSGEVLAAGDGVVILSQGTELVALNAADGSQRWRSRTPAQRASIGAGLVLGYGPSGLTALDLGSGERRWAFVGENGDCVLTGSGDGSVVSSGATVVRYDRDGGEVWRTSRGSHESPVQLATTTSPGLVVLAWAEWDETDPRSLVDALDPWTGDVVWRYVGPRSNGVGAPIVAEDRVLVPFLGTTANSTTLVALDAETGRRRWQEDLGAGHLELSYAGDDDLVLRTTDDGRTEAIDAVDGRPRWTGRARAPAWGTPGVIDGAVVVPTGAGIAVHEATTGDLRWDVAVSQGAHRDAHFAADGDSLVVADGEALVVVELATGEVVDRVELVGPVWGGISVADGVAHVATRRGIEIIDLQDGRRLTSMETDRLVVAPPLLVRGRMVVCLEGGTVALYD